MTGSQLLLYSLKPGTRPSTHVIGNLQNFQIVPFRTSPVSQQRTHIPAPSSVFQGPTMFYVWYILQLRLFPHPAYLFENAFRK